MSGKKIFVASITWEVEMYVLAGDLNEAHQIADDNAEDELRGGYYPPSIIVSEANPERCAKEDTVPYGDDGSEKTVAELVAERAELEQEEARRRDFEARQIKMPWGAP